MTMKRVAEQGRKTRLPRGYSAYRFAIMTCQRLLGAGQSAYVVVDESDYRDFISGVSWFQAAQPRGDDRIWVYSRAVRHARRQGPFWRIAYIVTIERIT